MRVTRLIAFLVTTLAAITLASCNHKDEMEPTYDPGAVVFNVSSQVITDHGIEVVVTHNGGKMDGWVGFLTEDMTTPVYDLIRSQAVPVTRPDFHFGTSQTVILTGLDADKDYRYIAYGMKDDKTIYGIPGVAAFTTSEDLNAIVFSIELIEARGHEADFHVTHTGKEENTWYGFPTADLETDINDLIAAKAGSVDIFNRGADVKISALELDSDSAYRYIVFGIKEDGVVYGTPASIEFNTAEDLDGVQFTAKAKNLTESTADITVSHDGRDTYQWFGFLTEDVEVSVARLVSEKVATVTEADLQTGKDVTITLEDLEIGKPYKYIVAGYKNGEAYGKPGVAEFELSGGEEQSPYEKWLGKWTATGSDGGEMNFEITQKVVDESYYIVGFDGDTKVEAGFDPESGDLLLLFQAAGSSSSWQFYLAGIGTNNHVAYGDNDKGILGIVSLTGEGTAKGVGNEYDYTYNDGSTEHFLVSWIGLFGYGQRSDGSTGWVSFTDVTYHYFPSDWIKTEDGEGGEEGGEGDYESFIGSWTDGTNTYTITQATANSTYTVAGFGLDVKARYNNGILEFYGQELGSDDTYTYYFYGVDQDKYLEGGAQDGTNLLAKGTIASDGSLKIVGHEYVATYSEVDYDEIIVQLGIFGEASDGKTYGFNELPYLDLPATLTSAGAGAPRKGVAVKAQVVEAVKSASPSYQVRMPKGVFSKR